MRLIWCADLQAPTKRMHAMGHDAAVRSSRDLLAERRGRVMRVPRDGLHAGRDGLPGSHDRGDVRFERGRRRMPVRCVDDALRGSPVVRGCGAGGGLRRHVHEHVHDGPDGVRSGRHRDVHTRGRWLLGLRCTGRVPDPPDLHGDGRGRSVRVRSRSGVRSFGERLGVPADQQHASCLVRDGAERLRGRERLGVSDQSRV